MTFRQLREALSNLTDEQLDLDATAYLIGDQEYFPIVGVGTENITDVLDENHPYIEVQQ